ncbi:MAG: tetratricopeptide repeat protein, partial [Planctomycetota bacterium]
LYARTLLETGHAADAFEFCLARVMQAAQSWDAGAAEEPRAAGLLALTLESGRATGGLAAWIEQVAAEAAAGRSLELARRLARRLSADGDYTAARPLWRALTQVQPESADDAWHYASALRDSGDLVAALDALTEFVRAREDGAGITPERLAAWMRSFRSTNEFLRTVEERAARAAGDYAASTVLGMTAAAAGQVELAERLLGAAVAARPDNAALAELAWARMLLASYRWEETLAHAEKALAAAPHLAAAHLAKAEAYTGLDQTADAEQAYKAALAAQPDHADYLAALARHYRRAGNTLAAQRYYQQAWLADHTQAEALEELIDSYVEEQKLEVARNCLKQAEASDVPEDTLRRIRTTLAHVGTTAEEHRAELQRQFEAHPEDFLTGLRLATALYLAHEPAAALRVLERIRDLKPDDERLIFVQVRVHLRLVEREPAIALLTEQVRRYPNRRPLLRTLADACIADFRFDEGRRTLERMLVLPGTPEQRQEVRNALLATWLELGDYGPALELLDEWLTAEPDSAALHQAKIRVLLEAKRYEEAVVLAEAQMTPAAERWAAVRARYQQVFDEVRARTAAGEDTQSQEQALERELRGPLNNLYERRGDYVQACMAARRFAELERQLRAWQADEPEQTQLTEWLVALLIETQDADGASAALGKLVPKTPAEVLRALLWRARITAADHPAGALEQLANLLKEGYVKDNIATRNEVQSEIIQVLIGSGDYTRALELCESWAAATSQADLLGRYMVLRLKRFVLGAAGRLDEQMAVAEQMLALQPHEPGLNNDVGYTWIDRGEQLDRAFEMIRLAVAAEPLNAAFLDSLGWAYYKRGDFAAARTQLERAVRLREGQDATVYDHLGDAAYRLKDQRAAREYWGKALELAEAPEPDVQPATQTAPASRPGAASQPGAASAPTRQEPAARQEPRPPLVNEAQLIAALRTKLAALERGETPRVAPVATVAPGTGQ